MSRLSSSDVDAASQLAAEAGDELLGASSEGAEFEPDARTGGSRRSRGWVPGASAALVAGVGLVALGWMSLASSPAPLARIPVHAASGGRMSYPQLSEVPEGACTPSKTWCSRSIDTMSYRDCDGDGIKDPYCQGGELLKFGYLGSKDHECKDNWPNGLCQTPGERASAEIDPSKLEPAKSNEITVIHFNDVYQVAGVLEGGVRRGGMSRAAHVIQKERARNPDRTFVVFAGDLLSPSVLSDLFEGAQMVDILNYLSLDAASLGNHEFDFGVDTLGERIKESKFPWLNTNLLDASTNKILGGTTERLIREVPWAPRFAGEGEEQGKLKVCLFGAAYDVRESMFKDKERIRHLDTAESARKEAAHLRREEGCHVVLALTHQFSRFDCQLAKELGSDIDLILGGHDHSTELNTVCGHAPYVKADSDLKTQWVMSIFLKDDGSVEAVEGKLLELTDSDPFDKGVHDKVVEWEDKGKAEMGKGIGCSSVDLDARASSVRQGETAVGNFFTDAVKEFHKTDVVLVNGGTIRGNRVFPKGTLTKLDVTSMHPFGNAVAKIYASGKEVRSYIEESLACYADLCGAFVVVAGLKYEFDPSAKPGARLTKLTWPSGLDVEDDVTMTVALTDYMLANSPLKENKLYEMVTLNDAVPLVTALFEYVKGAGSGCIHPEIDGRMKKL